MPSWRRLFVLLYAASGAAALVYEITWTRLLTLVMGHTVAAASTVLAAIMGGLALGSWLGARAERRWTGPDRPVHALRAYAALEVLVAVVALLLPYLLTAATPLLAWAYHDGQAPLSFGAVRALVALLLVGLPATAMGATFPIAVSWFAAVAADAGVLYATNTAGAALGAAATGFLLIPALGARGTTLVGAVLNIAAAAGAFWLATRPVAAAEAASSPAAKRPSAGKPRKGQPAPAARGSSRPLSPPAPGLAMGAAAASGFCALIYEVVWTRLVALVVGPTTYAFATVVAAFIVGLAFGSAAGARLVRHSRRPAAWLGGTLVVAAVASSAAGWYAATALPLVVAGQVAATDASFGPIVTRQVLSIVALLLPMTLALGAAFPLAMAVATPADGNVSEAASRVYVANTLGAIAGSLCGGFVLLPALGLRASLAATAGLGLLAAAGVWVADRRGSGTEPVSAKPWIVRGAAVGVAAAVLALLPGWDLNLLAGGIYKYAPYIAPADLQDELHIWKMLFYRDGATATVSVRELAGQRSLVIDGKVDASNMGDMLTQRLLGLLPAMVHTGPGDVLVLGLGSGVTVDSAFAPGTVKSVDVIEISPEVVEASAYFARENGDVLRRPGVHLIVGDGRSHLAFTKRQYDVVVSEPSNPWMAGIASLFTREFFQTVRGRLKPGGVICQWAHTYDISRDDLRSIVRTFGEVFPESSLWLVGDGDLLMIGTNSSDINQHVAGLDQRLAGGQAARLLAEVGMTGPHSTFALMSLLAGGPNEVKRYGAGAPIQTDDRMSLEFSAPRAIYGRSTDDNAAELRTLTQGAPLPAVGALWARATDAAWAAAGKTELKGDAYNAAFDRFMRALAMSSRNVDALTGLSDAAAGAQKPDLARLALERIAADEPRNAEVRVELSRVYASGGNMEKAAGLASEAMQLSPDDPRTTEQLASVFADAGDGDRLLGLSSAMVGHFPGRDRPLYFRATALMLKNRATEAVAEIRPVVARTPGDVRSQNLLGVACATVGDRACALAAFQAAMAANPRDPSTLVNLGVFYMQTEPTKAAEAFQTALTFDRTSQPARQGLAEARAALGRK